MFDETSRSHTDDDSTRHIHRGHRPSRRSIPAGLPRSQSPPAAGRMQIPARPTRNEVLFC